MSGDRDANSKNFRAHSGTRTRHDKMIRKQLDLVHTACPCIRNYATNTRTTSRPARPEFERGSYNNLPTRPSNRPPSRRRDDVEGGPSSTTPRRENIGRSAAPTPGTFRRRTQLTEGDDQPQLPRYLWREPAYPPPTSLSTRSQEPPGASRRKIQLAEGGDQPQLPRYLRRESAHSSTISPSTRAQGPPGQRLSGLSSERVFRSRHFDPTQAKDSKSEMKLLEPHVLSARLRKLCNASQIDAAVALLKNSPLDAQNTPVWNTLIWECMKAKRFKLGYQLFVDVCRISIPDILLYH
jgi:hypothetical protein